MRVLTERVLVTWTVEVGGPVFGLCDLRGGQVWAGMKAAWMRGSRLVAFREVLQEALEEGVAATVGDGGAMARGLCAVSWGTRASWGLGGLCGE